MKKFLMFFWLALIGVSAQNCKIQFTVYAHGLTGQDSVFIVGNHPSLGQWNPGRVKLTHQLDTVFTGEVIIPSGYQMEYKFTRGSWSSEALNPQGNIPENSILNVHSDTLVTVWIPGWSSNTARPAFRGQITGTVRYHPEMEGEGILPRNVIVWLPEGYDQQSTRRYPVLYMHDGQNVFDPLTSSFGVDWQADETADSLIKAGIIEPIIIVGVYCTTDRFLDYSPGPKGNAYMDFLTYKLKPFIDSTYRTLPDRQHTAVAGSSMGGIISMMIGWERNAVFSKVAAFSPAFKIESLDYVFTVKTTAGKKDLQIYIDNGGIDLEKRLQPGVDEMLTVLREKGYHDGVDLLYVSDPEASHTEAAWAKRLANPLKMFFGKK